MYIVLTLTSTDVEAVIAALSESESSAVEESHRIASAPLSDGYTDEDLACARGAVEDAGQLLRRFKDAAARPWPTDSARSWASRATAPGRADR